MAQNKKPQQVANQQKYEDFSNWYNDLVERAELTDKRYPIKGMNVWRPYGWKAMSLIDGLTRKLMDEADHGEVCFPLLVPQTEFQKEADHVKGFDAEVYWVKHAGLNKLDVPLLLRPTSETAMYPVFALWIRSHADLPLKTYQIVNTFRYDTKMTRPFIRVREIHFFEAHTCHADEADAEANIDCDLNILAQLCHDLCLPYLMSRRPEWDKFPGAHYTLGADAFMPNGRMVQIATIHQYLENFSRPYDVKFEEIPLPNYMDKLMEKMGYSERISQSGVTSIPFEIMNNASDEFKTMWEYSEKNYRLYQMIYFNRKNKIAKIVGVATDKCTENDLQSFLDFGQNWINFVNNQNSIDVQIENQFWLISPDENVNIDIDQLISNRIKIITSYELDDLFGNYHIKPYRKFRYVHQTTYGMSERLLGAIVAIHGDDNGLILPPAIAPLQIVIVPIPVKGKIEIVSSAAKDLYNKIKKGGFRVKLDMPGPNDTRDRRPGEKFYHWEQRGVPLRLELGPRDIEKNMVMLARRDTGEKWSIQDDEYLNDKLRAALASIAQGMLERATKNLAESLVPVKDVYDEPDEGKVSYFGWCGSEDCAEDIEKGWDVKFLGVKEIRESVPLEGLGYQPKVDDIGGCIVCGRPEASLTFASKQM